MLDVDHTVARPVAPPVRPFYNTPVRPAGVQETSQTVSSLVEQFMDGTIQLPEIQREYVWTREKVRALVDSLYKGYPSGSILLWDTDDPVQTRPTAAAEADSGTAKATRLLLDGQQRITSLAAVTRGIPVRMKSGGTVTETTVEIHFNIDHPDRLPDSDSADDDGDGEEEEEDEDAGGKGAAHAHDHRIFRLASKSNAGGRHWIPVTEVFKNGAVKALLDAGITLADPNAQKYLTRLNRLSKLKDYKYPVQVLEKDTPYSEVTDIFVRLNSQGAKLSRADLALAQVTARWRGAMKEFTAASDKCRKRGFDLDEKFMIRYLLSVSARQNKFESVRGIKTEKLKRDWERAKRGLFFAIDLLKRDAGIESTEVLGSKLPLIPVACLAVENKCAFSEDVRQKVIRWIYAAIIWSRYSRGATETLLDEDLASIRKKGDPAGEMIERIRKQTGRLCVQASDLEGKTRRSSLLGMVYVLATRSGAKDWGSGLALGMGPDRGFKAMQRPVFSAAVVASAMRRAGGTKGAARLAGDIANIVFSPGHAAGAGGARPADYLPPIVDGMGAEALEAQCVPTDPGLWEADRYKEFLAQRRQLIADGINRLVEPPRGGGPDPDGDAKAIAGGESLTVELKSSMLYDYERDGGTANAELKRALLKEIVALMNTEGGTIYVGVSDDGALLGIERDMRLLGKRAGWDKWSLALTNAVKTLGAAAARNVSCKPIKMDGRTIARIAVRRGASPAYLDPAGKAEFVMRSDTASILLNTKEATEYIRDRFPGRG